MNEELIQILKSKKLIIENIESASNSFVMTFNVWAKPGSKVEKSYVSSEGILIVQTRSKPIDGEANQAIIEVVSKNFGIPKSQVEIVRGDKSRVKHIKIQVIFTANKNKEFFEKKFIAISSQEA